MSRLQQDEELTVKYRMSTCYPELGIRSLNKRFQLGDSIKRQLCEDGGGVGVLRVFECVFAGGVGAQGGVAFVSERRYISFYVPC